MTYKDDPISIFIGGIPLHLEESDIIQYFKKFGTILNCFIQRHNQTLLSRGYAFIVFANKEEGIKCTEHPNHIIAGRNITCSIAKSKSDAIKEVFDKQPNKLFLGGVQSNITEDELRTLFSAFGSIKKIYLIYDKVTNKSKGFGFLEYEKSEVAEKVADMHYIMVKNCRIEIKKKQLKNEIQKNDALQNTEILNYGLQNTYEQYDRYDHNNPNMRLKYDTNNMELDIKMNSKSNFEHKKTLSTAERTLPSGVNHTYPTQNSYYDISQQMHPKISNKSSSHYDKYQFESSENFYNRKKWFRQEPFMNNSSFLKGHNRINSEENKYKDWQNRINEFPFEDAYLNNKNLCLFDNEMNNYPHSFYIDSDLSKSHSNNYSIERFHDNSYESFSNNKSSDKLKSSWSMKNNYRFMNKGRSENIYTHDLSNENSGISSSLSPIRVDFRYYEDYSRQINSPYNYKSLKLNRNIKRGYEQGIEQNIKRGYTQGFEQNIKRGYTQGFEQNIKRGYELGIDQNIKKCYQQGIEQNKFQNEYNKHRSYQEYRDTYGPNIDKYRGHYESIYNKEQIPYHHTDQQNQRYIRLPDQKQEENYYMTSQNTKHGIDLKQCEQYQIDLNKNTENYDKYYQNFAYKDHLQNRLSQEIPINNLPEHITTLAGYQYFYKDMGSNSPVHIRETNSPVNDQNKYEVDNKKSPIAKVNSESFKNKKKENLSSFTCYAKKLIDSKAIELSDKEEKKESDSMKSSKNSKNSKSVKKSKSKKSNISKSSQLKKSKYDDQNLDTNENNKIEINKNEDNFNEKKTNKHCDSLNSKDEKSDVNLEKLKIGVEYSYDCFYGSVKNKKHNGKQDSEKN